MKLSDIIGPALLGVLTSSVLFISHHASSGTTDNLSDPVAVSVSTENPELPQNTSVKFTDAYAEEVAAVAEAVEDARSIGYQVCTPTVVDIGWYGPEQAEGAAAWATWNPCLIGVRHDLEDPDHPLYHHQVARHEVCHLATGPIIDTVPDTGDDIYHTHVLFTDCLRTLGGS